MELLCSFHKPFNIKNAVVYLRSGNHGVDPVRPGEGASVQNDVILDEVGVIHEEHERFRCDRALVFEVNQFTDPQVFNVFHLRHEFVCVVRLSGDLSNNLVVR